MGEEKINKAKEVFERFIAFCKRNVKTNIATVVNFFASLGSGATLGGGLYFGGVALPVWSYYVIGVVLTIVMFIGAEFGIVAEGLEDQEQYDARIAKEKAEKEAKKLEAEAKKAEKEEIAKIKAEEEAKAKEEEQMRKAIAEEQAKIKAEEDAIKKAQELELRKAQLLAQYNEAVANGFNGSFVDFLNKK